MPLFTGTHETFTKSFLHDMEGQSEIVSDGAMGKFKKTASTCRSDVQ